jgi:hypothetical protein
MELLGDEAQLEADFGSFGDSVSVVAGYVHGLHQAYDRLINRFKHN